MRFAAILVILVAAIACVSASDSEFILPAATYVTMFKSFITKARRTFSAANFAKKLEVFKKNVDRITNLNKSGGKVQYGVNNLADLEAREFTAMLGFRPGNVAPSFVEAESEADAEAEESTSAENAPPASIDWTSNGGKNHLQAVQFQSSCGSCWAYTAVACIEAQMSIKFGVSTKVSEQAILSCSAAGTCKGGTYHSAFNSIKAGTTSIVTAAKYPYKNQQTFDICATVKADKSVGYTVSRFDTVKNNDAAFMTTLSTKGPIGVSIDASQMQFYKSGIIPHTNCSGGVNHGVVLVGFGGSGDNAFWKIRNSWGDWWGVNGYLQIARNGKNTCSMRTYGAYPTLAKV